MKALVLLHGALGAAADFAFLAPLLPEPLYTPDFPGHGKNGTTEPFNLNSLSSWLCQYIESLPEEEISVFGYSMGGYIALQSCLTGCKKIRSITTLGTKLHWDEAIAAAAKPDPDQLQKNAPQFCENLQDLHGDNWRALVNNTGAFLQELGKNNPLNPENLAKIEIQVKLMRGDRDKMTGMAETLDAFDAMQHAKLSILPGTPHQLNRVNPHRLVFELTEMLAAD